MIKFNPAPLFQPRVETNFDPPPRLSTPPPKEKFRPPPPPFGQFEHCIHPVIASLSGFLKKRYINH